MSDEHNASRLDVSPHTRGDGPYLFLALGHNSSFSPHAWGWSALENASSRYQSVLPTRVGMVRLRIVYARVVGRSPHTRGDGPQIWHRGTRVIEFSPHAWGWSDRNTIESRCAEVLPTRVGMVRSQSRSRPCCSSSPHTRGDGPVPAAVREMAVSFSPHAWGWSAVSRCERSRRFVLPTRVGMVRCMERIRKAYPCSPHTRGDGPTATQILFRTAQFSPHAWGWSVVEFFPALGGNVLPTRVGMVRDKPGPSPPLYVVTTLCAACPISSVCGHLSEAPAGIAESGTCGK